MSFFTKTKEATFEELNTSKNGLTEEEASKRLEEYGHNKLAEGKKKGMLSKFIDQFKNK
jgi:Ca2+-transporting ATPase